MPSDQRYILYHYDTCFYCRRVRQAMERLGVEAELRDIRREPTFRTELMSATGRRTVPVLRIESEDGTQWMPESRDIVRYLESLPTPRAAAQ